MPDPDYKVEVGFVSRMTGGSESCARLWLHSQQPIRVDREAADQSLIILVIGMHAEMTVVLDARTARQLARDLATVLQEPRLN